AHPARLRHGGRRGDGARHGGRLRVDVRLAARHMVRRTMDDALLRDIRAAADATRETIVRDLQALVRIPSYSPAAGGPGEGAAQEYLAAAYAGLGCRITRFEPDVAALHARFPTVRQSVQAPDFASRPN